MDAKVRTLGLVGAVLILGGIGGVVLGNFVTISGNTGAEELAAYWSDVGLDEADPTLEERAPAPLATRNGPTSYHCEGCDAGLHRVPVYLEPLPADYAPLPPYEVVDLQERVAPMPRAQTETTAAGTEAVTTIRPKRISPGLERNAAPPIASAPILTEPMTPR